MKILVLISVITVSSFSTASSQNVTRTDTIDKTERVYLSAIREDFIKHEENLFMGDNY